MKARLLTSILALSGALLVPGFAHDDHDHDHELIRQSACGGGVKSKVSASPENGRIEVEYEVDNAQPGDTWRIVIRRNGKVILRTRKRVNAAGNAEIRVLTPNGNGNERIAASATRVGGGGSCEATVVVNF
jgi:hypothetical protein